MSEFVIKNAKAGQAAAAKGVKADGTINADDGYARTQVRQERIWVEAVDRENKSMQEWQTKWSFLAEYDPKGNPKVKEPLPTKLAFFSDKLPSCSGHTYGYLLNTPAAKQMESMQRALAVTTKRRKNVDLINYA